VQVRGTAIKNSLHLTIMIKLCKPIVRLDICIILTKLNLYIYDGNNINILQAIHGSSINILQAIRGNNINILQAIHGSSINILQAIRGNNINILHVPMTKRNKIIMGYTDIYDLCIIIDI